VHRYGHAYSIAATLLWRLGESGGGGAAEKRAQKRQPEAVKFHAVEDLTVKAAGCNKAENFY
jgi:hypothetical protein